MPADRDVLRRKSPPPEVAQQIAAPVEISGEVTGKYAGDELASRRAERPTDERIARLENWKDQVTPVIHATGAKVDTLLDYAAKAEAERERRAARDAEELARKRSHSLLVIKAIGAALALIVAAYVGRGAL